MFALFTKRGKGWMLGGTIIKSFREVEARRWMMRNRLRVHLIKGRDSRKKVGLEILMTGPGGMTMPPISLSPADARFLADMLTKVSGAEAGRMT